jgi:hypothetical protein
MKAEAAATARTVEEPAVAREVEHRQSAARAVGTTAFSGRFTTNAAAAPPPSWPATDERVAASRTAAASASVAAILRGSPLRRASASWRRR